MTPEQILQAAKAQRETLVLIGDGKQIRIRRPSQVEVLAHLRSEDGKTQISITGAQAKAYVTGWEGFKECDFILGGASDAAEFHPDLLAFYLSDHPDVSGQLAQALVDAIVAHQKTLAETQKN